MLNYILLIIGFVVLIKGADMLVDGACSIAKRLKVSDLAIGLTVVAFGTSMPELFVNIIASASNSPEIAIGNVLGSNICNILLILGVAALIYPLSVTKGTVWKEIPLALLSVVILGIMANDQIIDKGEVSSLTRIDGIILFLFFIIFIYYVFNTARKKDLLTEKIPQKVLGTAKSIIFIIVGLVGLAIGGKWIVQGAVYMATNFGLSESFIGLTIVAIGTSLPELATSVVAALKKNSQIAIGNVVGSNIFNILFILGIGSIIKPIPFQPHSNFDIAMTLIASLILFISIFIGRRHVIDRWQGLVFLALYIGYLIFLVHLG